MGHKWRGLPALPQCATDHSELFNIIAAKVGWADGGGGGEGHVWIVQGSSAVYTCLHTGTMSLLQGCSLLLVSSHLITLASKLLLQLEVLVFGIMQVSVPPSKLLLQLF